MGAGCVRPLVLTRFFLHPACNPSLARYNGLMAATTTPKEQAMTYRSYQLTGDVLVDRRHYVEAGRPSDHPYIVDCAKRVADPAPTGPVTPLAVTLTSEQVAYMAEAAPVMRAQSDANVAAMLRGGGQR